jgi:hypothetical protein
MQIKKKTMMMMTMKRKKKKKKKTMGRTKRMRMTLLQLDILMTSFLQQHIAAEKVCSTYVQPPTF